MSKLKLGALALTATLALIAGVTTLAEPKAADAASNEVSWTGQTRTLKVWPTGADQAVGVGVVELRYSFPGTITRVAVGSGWKVKDQTTSSFTLTNTSAFVARSLNRDAVSSPSIRVDGKFRPECSDLKVVKGGSKIITGDDLDRGRITML